MTYADILNTWVGSMWRYASRAQGNVWTKTGTANSWKGTSITAVAGAADATGFDGGNGWVAGSFYSTHSGDTSANDGVRAATMLIKVDPTDAVTETTLFSSTNSSLAPTNTGNVKYNPVTDTISTVMSGGSSWTAGIKDNQWHHLALIPMGTGWELYVDGDLLGQVMVDGGNANSSKTFFLGGSPISPGIVLDELVVYPAIVHTNTFPMEHVTSQSDYVKTTWNAPLEYTATAATASATAVEPSFYGFNNPVSFAATPAGATAAMGSNLASVTRRELSTEVRSPAATIQTGEYVTMVPGDNRSLFIEVPYEGMYATDLTLAMRKVSTTAGGTFKVYAASYDGSTFTRGGALSADIAPVFTMTGHQINNIPAETRWVEVLFTYSVSNISVDNPANDTSVNSYFMAKIAPVVRFNATPATAQGNMPESTVTNESSVSAGAQTMTATAEMLNGRFPDYQYIASLVSATAEMREAWASSSTTGIAEAMSVTAEMLSDVTVERVSNIQIAAAPALMTRSRIVNPEEVDFDISDPAYFDRVTGRSLAGALPPRVGEWFRLKETSGDKAYITDFNTGVKTDKFGLLSGVYAWGAEGPQGRRALSVSNAGLNVARSDTFASSEGGGSLEFTVKVAPGHTGQMDIANGFADFFADASSTGPKERTHVSVRNGRLYARTTFGGTSMKRIDDGEWHHIVVTTSPTATSDNFYSGTRTRLELWIDGVRDRSLFDEENRNSGGTPPSANLFARPDYYFGAESGFPFKGDITEIAFRERYLTDSEIADLYYDMFGYKPVRPGIVGAAVGAMGQETKVVSNTKRMLVLSWDIPSDRYGLDMTWRMNDGNMEKMLHPRSLGVFERTDKPILSPMMGYGFDNETEMGRYMLTYQSVATVWDYNQARSVVKPEVIEAMQTDPAGRGRPFRDTATGQTRLINLQTDIDLDDFEVIAFQAYPNVVYKDQAERLKFEAFFDSVNQALVDGHKLWVTDAFLASDLGWVTKVDEVPVFADLIDGRIQGSGGNDVRGFEVAPHIGNDGVPMELPADGSMPQLETGIPEGSAYGIQNLWKFDMHKNNGYRVLNEIDGLTDLPSHELVESFFRDRRVMIPADEEWEQYGYKMENRTGETWESESINPTTNTPWRTEPATGLGLSAGDEFYDFRWFQAGKDLYQYSGGANYMAAESAKFNRALSTWAIPAGHLKIGTPVTSFRTKVWNDYGKEVANPYRNHIRNAVVRAGDRLPDGRKVSGYAFMEFAEQPWLATFYGHGVTVDEHWPPGSDFGAIPVVPTYNGLTLIMEDAYSNEWDLLTLGRTVATGGGVYERAGFSYVVATYIEGKKANAQVTHVPALSLGLPQERRQAYNRSSVVNLSWNGRGIMWLTLVDSTDNEVALASGDVAEATASMVSPAVHTEFDNVVTVGAANASATIVDPGESVVKSVRVITWPGAATAKMNGLQGGYVAQAAESIGDMPQNILRPLDSDEVIFFTVTFNLETIYMRMEEN